MLDTSRAFVWRRETSTLFTQSRSSGGASSWQTNKSEAFSHRMRTRRYKYSNRDAEIDPELQSRMRALQIQTLETTFRLPPNPNLSAVDTVAGVLNSLQRCDDPSPDAGIRSLLRTSTLRWKQLLYESVGAVDWHTTKDEHVISALRSSMGRPNNQFRILVEDEGEESFSVVFPSDPLDYMDGTCWVECQLRRRNDDTLLITMGWQLEKENDCWMIDRIDWQDFRDAFRPGIGREEWMRICG